ncbi:MAG: hypothetical protein AABY32_05095 [Nanoarchaeota archaeon]
MKESLGWATKYSWFDNPNGNLEINIEPLCKHIVKYQKEILNTPSFEWFLPKWLNEELNPETLFIFLSSIMVSDYCLWNGNFNNLYTIKIKQNDKDYVLKGPDAYYYRIINNLFPTKGSWELEYSLGNVYDSFNFGCIISMPELEKRSQDIFNIRNKLLSMKGLLNKVIDCGRASEMARFLFSMVNQYNEDKLYSKPQLISYIFSTIMNNKFKKNIDVSGLCGFVNHYIIGTCIELGVFRKPVKDLEIKQGTDIERKNSSFCLISIHEACKFLYNDSKLRLNRADLCDWLTRVGKNSNVNNPLILYEGHYY